MAAKWPGQDQYQQAQQATAYQQPATNNSQQTSYPQNAGYNAAAYQQYYAHQYGTVQGYQQQAWSYNQYQQQYPQQAGWPPNYQSQQYPVGYQQQLQYPQQSTAQSVVPPWSNNTKGVSCYNCGAKDHWAAACPRPSRSAYGYAMPNTAAVPPPVPPTTTAPYTPQAAGTAHKGPVVTKYAVPPHIAAQMKARGVPGAPTVAPVLSGPAYGSQYPGWPQWQAQTAGPTVYQSESSIQNSDSTYVHPSQGNTSAQVPISTTVTQAETAVTSPINVTTNEMTVPEVQSSKKTEGLRPTKEDPVPGTEKEQDQEEDLEDDITSLDIPDMPQSYGTSAYIQPKLLSKPVYALAPEWTQSGYGEITICYDPNGRTESDYIKRNDLESAIESLRTAAHDEDPIFAVIDLNAPPIMDTRSLSRDSGTSEFETPLTYDSGETRPTSIDEVDETHTRSRRRRKSGTPVYHKHRRYDDFSPRGNAHDNYRRRHYTERRGSNAGHDKKRKHEGEGYQGSPPKEDGPQSKKSRSEVDPVDELLENL